MSTNTSLFSIGPLNAQQKMCNNSQPLSRTILEQSYTRPFHKFEQIEQKWKNKFKIFCQTDIGPVVEEDGGEEAGEG